MLDFPDNIMDSILVMVSQHSGCRANGSPFLYIRVIEDFKWWVWWKRSVWLNFRVLYLICHVITDQMQLHKLCLAYHVLYMAGKGVPHMVYDCTCVSINNFTWPLTVTLTLVYACKPHYNNYSGCDKLEKVFWCRYENLKFFICSELLTFL